MKTIPLNRSHGLDILRSLAIILVFTFHCFITSKWHILRCGWVGVDLFFVLSGYLIAHQIFSTLNKQTFSLKIFYYRRFLRTLPNYLVILAIYFLIPFCREAPLENPLWKFLTFTQNFGLHESAFSQSWSLCVEEQFYFFLPLIVLFVIYKGLSKLSWFIIAAILLGGIILRGTLWFIYLQHPTENILQTFLPVIYYPSYCRLDGLVLGVAIAMLRDYHPQAWQRITAQGNWFMLFGLIGFCFIFYPFHNSFNFFLTTFGFPLRTAIFAALTIAALSPSSFFYRLRIPGATTLATLSYAIYLTHKQLIYINGLAFARFGIDPLSITAIGINIFICLAVAWLLYTFVENPFLKLRDKISKQAAEKTPLVTAI